MQEIIDILPFSNDLEVLVVSGQDILDALEFGAKELPNPTSRFPQVSGMSYKVNMSINTSIVLDEYENFVSVGGQRRVYDVKVGDEAIDANKNYTLTASNFITHGGDGYSMFKKYEAINNAIGTDNEVFLDYVQKDLNGTIPEKYRTTEGRILIVNGTEATLPSGGGLLPDDRSDDIVILHTNDVHCGIQDIIGYDGLNFYKKQLQKKYKNVLVVDSGDHIQGGTIGLITEGEDIIDTMNEVGFDAVTVGNHEFDYGVDRLLELNKNLSCRYISSNIYYRKNKTAMFPPYVILPLNGTDKKIAFVGVATPQTLTKTSLITIVDDDGKPTYDFLTEGNGPELYAKVQENIDAARSEGADYVIILAHLGKGGDAIHAYTSGGLMENLQNVDALLDGHSHEIYSNLTKDKNNKEVILAQTGTKLATLGVLTIHTNGTLTHELLDSIPLIDNTLNETEYLKVTRSGIETYVDSDMAAFISVKLELLNEILGEIIGYTPFELNIYEDPNDKSSLKVNRLNESTLCNLVADSYRAAGKSDVTLLNAGAVRIDLNAGNITMQEIIDILPFSNDLEVLVVSGQDILDALEFGAKELPNPTSRFPQVSGMS
jgi:2',3'-cyclic-nucleotide 2'-phosphodiesterase (5'-nucleotidase family)